MKSRSYQSQVSETKSSQVERMILFPLGFLMFMAGFALVVYGKFEFGGYQFSTLATRSAGVIFLLFFPLIFLYGFLRELFSSQTWMEEQLALVQWSIGILCLGGGLFILMRSAANSRPKKPTPMSQVNAPMLVDQGEEAPAPPPASAPPNFSPIEPKPKQSRRGNQRNPFDFS